MVLLQGFIIYLLNCVSEISKASVGQRKHPEKAEIWVQRPPNYAALSEVLGPQAFRNILFSFSISSGMETLCKVGAEQLFL